MRKTCSNGFTFDVNLILGHTLRGELIQISSVLTFLILKFQQFLCFSYLDMTEETGHWVPL